MAEEIKKILIVEDDDDLRKILVDSLATNNYRVVEAVDGEQAIGLIVDLLPNIILLDLLLPKLDGFAVLERVRHYPDSKVAGTPVVVFSNLWSDKDILRARALKVDEYFVKANTDLKDVLNKIHEILASRV